MTPFSAVKRSEHTKVLTSRIRPVHGHPACVEYHSGCCREWYLGLICHILAWDPANAIISKHHGLRVQFVAKARSRDTTGSSNIFGITPREGGAEVKKQKRKEKGEKDRRTKILQRF